MTNFLNNPYLVVNGCILFTWILFCILQTIGYLTDRHKTIYRPKFETELIKKANGSAIKYFFAAMFNKAMISIILVLTIIINLIVFIF